jgi:glutaredoxin
MVKVKVEIFSGDPPCPGCEALLKIADWIEKKYKGKVDVYRYVGEGGVKKFEAYKLDMVPTIVVNEKIRVIGMCPSMETVEAMLREAGL